jgi:hypothetical protein
MAMRLKGPEFQQDVAIPTAGFAATGLGPAQQIATWNPVKRDRAIHELIVSLRMRITIGATAPTSALPEAPWGFLQNLLLQGEHKVLGNRFPCNLDGPILRVLQLRGGSGAQFPYLKVSDNGAAFVVQQFLQNPIAAHTYDIVANFLLPFYLIGSKPEENVLWALNGPDWNVLNLFTTVGDASAIYLFNAGQVVTFGGFQGAGTPTLRLYLVRANLGGLRGRVSPGIIQRNSLIFDRVAQGASFTDQPIQDLRRGLKVRGYLVKGGSAPATAPSAGVRVYGALNDNVVTRPKLKLNNVIIRDSGSADPDIYRDYYARKINNGSNFVPVGYAPIDFAEEQSALTLFAGDALTDADLLQLAGDVTGAANQQAEVVQELVEGTPVFFTPQGTVHGLTGQPV